MRSPSGYQKCGACSHAPCPPIKPPVGRVLVKDELIQLSQVAIRWNQNLNVFRTEPNALKGCQGLRLWSLYTSLKKKEEVSICYF